jgi:hypothetical protein
VDRRRGGDGREEGEEAVAVAATDAKSVAGPENLVSSIVHRLIRLVSA